MTTTRQFLRPTAIPSVVWPPALRLLVLAPHPDDFDAIGVTLKFFHQRGCTLHVAVVSGSASGVLDAFCAGANAKATVREQEQRASVQFFGLSDASLSFLRLPEDARGDPMDNAAAEASIGAEIGAVQPDLVLLPHGADTNIGHQRVAAMFRRVAPTTPAFLIRDPKTLDFRTDLFMPFDAELAVWKRTLLLHHRSQEHRNRTSRGHGFDDRILDVNRRVAEELACGAPFAEAFEVSGAWGFGDLGNGRARG